MIRFINLTDQIIEEKSEFAFYNTVTCSFLTFSGFQTWSTVKEFKQDYDGDDLERYLSLIPDDFGVKSKQHGWKDIQVTMFGVPLEGISSISYEKQLEITDLEIELQEALLNEDYKLAANLKKRIDNYIE